MPSKQTTTYKLSQWVTTDKVLMDDFNADNAKIDAAIKAADEKADGLSSSKAEKTDVSALQTAASGKGNCRVEVVTYTGDGSNTKSIRFAAKRATKPRSSPAGCFATSLPITRLCAL